MILEDFISNGPRSYILRGRLGNMTVIGKLSHDSHSSFLQNEFETYQALIQLQGSGIPRCLGLFDAGAFGLLLLLEDGGSSIGDFHELSKKQKYISPIILQAILLTKICQRVALLKSVSQMHQRGICHHDLEPRNIMVSPSGKVSVIDFEFSTKDHACHQATCHEIIDLTERLSADVN